MHSDSKTGISILADRKWYFFKRKAIRNQYYSNVNVFVIARRVSMVNWWFGIATTIIFGYSDDLTCCGDWRAA
jgi:hypothetical protein